jgi:hypothetical protein
MSNADFSTSMAVFPHRGFLHQTSAVVYSHPASDAEVLVRLHEGNLLLVSQPQSESKAGWLSVQTATGQNGFIRADTKTITHEQLLAERASTQRGYVLGRGKMILGGGILLAVLLGYFLLFADKRGGFARSNPVYLFYLGMAVGGGEFFWGLEQVVNVRHTLRKFDALWQEAF